MVSVGWMAKAVAAGLCGSIAHSLIMYLKHRAGVLPSFDPYGSLQTALGGVTGTAIHPVVPWLLSFLNGSAFTGLAFGYAYRWLPGSNGALKGALFGVIAWTIMGLVFFPLIGLGLFASDAGHGTAPAIFSLGMLLAYSVILGLVYGALKP